MSVGAVNQNFMEAVMNRALQAQGQALLDLLNVQKVSFEVNVRPLKTVATSSSKVDLVA